MDIDSSSVVEIPFHLSANNVLHELKSLVVVGSAFQAQDSMEKLKPSDLVNIALDYLEGVPQLLYSEEILNAMAEVKVNLPYIEVLQVKRKIKVLIGVSGCGKSRTCFDIGRFRFVIYFDCFADLDIKELVSRLIILAPKLKTAESQVEFEMHSQRLIKCLLLSRLIVLTQLRSIGFATNEAGELNNYSKRFLVYLPTNLLKSLLICSSNSKTS